MDLQRTAVGLDDRTKEVNYTSGNNYNETVMALTLRDDSGNDVDVTYEGPKEVERAGWSGKFDFIMTCVGYAVGLGNVWRFPYLCYKNGGGAFLVPYVTMLFFIGWPLFFLEFSFGQFASLGPISIWNISPLFKGVGYAMVLIAWILVVYYQVVVAHSFYFLFASMTSMLPWTNCNENWSSSLCFDNSNNISFANQTSYLTPSEDFYYNHVLGVTKGIEEFGLPSWKLALCLLLAWALCALAVIKGVQTLGKVSYFTAIFPYIMLTILLIRSCLLPGAGEGIVFYIKPNFSRLLDARVWVDAATQIFYSLGCCNGGLIAMSSFNKFKNNCCRDAMIVALLNCATSIYAGFVIFANLGFMAHAKNATIGDVVKSGPGLAFVIYPEAMTHMPLPSLWSVFFFFMMCTLGLGSQFSTLETVISSIQDELRRLGCLFTKRKEILFRLGICSFNFMLGFPMIFGGGYYLFYLVDNSLAGFPLLFVALVEIIVIIYIYGLKQFRRDIQLMINTRPSWYWRICWRFVTPFLCLCLIVFLLVAGDEFTVNGYKYPSWGIGLGHMISAAPIILIILWFLYKFCREGGFILMKELLKPVHEWGPAQKENRAEFISMIKSTESLHRSRINDIATAGVFPVPSGVNLYGSQIQQGYGLGGSLISGLAETALMEESKFFQSKLSVAEKLTQAHNKEIVKRVASNAEFGSVDAIGKLNADESALAAAAANSYILNEIQQDGSSGGGANFALPEDNPTNPTAHVEDTSSVDN